MTSIVGDLLELMPDTLTCTPGTTDGFGKFTASGAILSPRCRISGRERRIIDRNGQQVVSTMRAFMNGVNSLTVDEYRYTLPAKYPHRVDLTAIVVRLANDEDGAHHEVVEFA